MQQLSSAPPRVLVPSATSYGWDKVVVLANRAPFTHERDANGRMRIKRSASGLVTAIEPLIAACSGVWVAHGSGVADAKFVDERKTLDAAGVNPRYRLRYVRLSDDEYRGYYDGFANQGLWPLCHTVDVEPLFRSVDFRMYAMANARFAAAACDAAGACPTLFLVQDYHLALAPGILRRRRPFSTVASFWHIPWPSPRVLRACPWAGKLLTGLLGSDIVGLQTSADRHHFLESVRSILRARIDRVHSRVGYQGRSTLVGAYPVGIEWANWAVRAVPPARECRERVFRDLQLHPDTRLCIGIDRLDYTKGIHEKLLVVERVLELRPDLRGRLVLVQVAEPSRQQLPAYCAVRAKIVDTAQRVNARFGTASYRPIHLLDAHHEPPEVYRLYRAADVCYVGSLHDGMNLVAKEFVCAREDERGVLVLSQFAGAAQQLRAALVVNPYATDESAAILGRALALPPAEQRERMRLLRADVATFDASWWAHQLISDAAAMSNPRTVTRSQCQGAPCPSAIPALEMN